MTEPKWRRISRPFVAPAEILSPDGQQFLVYGADSLLAYLNFREQRISDLEAWAGQVVDLTDKYGVDDEFWVAWWDLRDALPSTTKETQ